MKLTFTYELTGKGKKDEYKHHLWILARKH